jgi:multiple sugar transport system ATP-binding protein
MIYVTHDQVEAMTLASKIVVLNKGRVEQIGAPLELYQRPANIFVAGFIGSPKMNLLPGKVLFSGGGSTVVDLAAGRITLPLNDPKMKLGDSVTLGVRPEDFAEWPEGKPAEPVFAGRVALIERLGGETIAYVELERGPAEPVIVKLPGDAAVAAGAPIRLTVDPAACHLFAADGLAVARR